MKSWPLITLLFCFALFSCSSSKKTAATTVPTAQTFIVDITGAQNKILVDGDLNEWNTSIGYKDNTTTLTTFITADSTNLYIAVRVDQQWLQMKILKMGMQIYFDPSGNESKSQYIAYPVMLQADDDQGLLSATANPNSKAVKQKLITEDIILQSTGLKITPDGMHQKYAADGPRVALGTDITNNLIYEAAIPLKEIYGENYLADIRKKPSLGIGIVINPFPKGDYNHSNTSMQTPTQGGGASGFNSGAGGGFNGSRGGGSRGGGGHRGGGGGPEPIYVKQDMVSPTNLWVNARFN
jgi:uncharacterized membrane protein YgcG